VSRSFTSSTAWAYYTGADHPADCPRQVLLRDDTHPPTATNVKQGKLDAFVVPHAVAIAGTPTATSLDRTTRTHTLAYRSTAVPGARLRRGARTAVFVPARMYPTGYVASVDGGHVDSAPNAPWLLLRAAPNRNVSVIVTPRE
jgi:endoglycosylceramidase